MKIEVHHQDGAGGFEHVATVNVPDEEASSLESALEYAWRWTNNVEGSWSRGSAARGKGDYNPNVLTRKPLQCDERGRAMGHRSSMVGDRFILDGVPYLVAGMGFELEG